MAGPEENRDWRRDYRWADFPARGYIVPHPNDCSVQTFRGHSVLQTLIRAYFSPAHTTGQRMVYAGSADGTVRIYGMQGCAMACMHAL